MKKKGKKGGAKAVFTVTEKREGLPKAIPILFLLLSILPVVAGFIFVNRYGVNACHWDNIDNVPLFEKYFGGTLDFSYFFSQHNEHRIAVPRAIHLLLGLATRYNNIAEMFLIVGCMTASLVLLLLPLRNRIREDPRSFFYLPVPFILMTFRQFQNMLSGFQLSFVLVQTFAVLSLLGLCSSVQGKGKRSLFSLVGLGSAVLASCSSAQGLLVWPAGFIPIVLSEEKSGKRMFLAVWIASALLVWGFYFWNYTKPSHHPSLTVVLRHPLDSLYFFSVLLGNALFWEEVHAFWAGLFLIGLFLLGTFASWSRGRSWSSREGRNDTFWIAMAIFSFLVLGSITVGRSGFGIRYAGESRYATYSVLAVVGIYCLLLENWIAGGVRLAKLSSWALLAIFVVSIPLSYLNGIRVGDGVWRGRSLKAYILYTYRYQPDEVLRTFIFPNPDIARERAAYLEKIGYNVFAAQGRR
jgi:hypothetical protein